MPGGTACIWRNVCLGRDRLGDSRHPEGQEEPAGTAHLGTAGAVRRSASRGAAGVRRDSACLGWGGGSWTCPEGQLVFWGQRVPERAAIGRDSVCLKGRHVAGGRQALGGRHVPGDSVRPGDSTPTTSLQSSHGDSRAGDVPLASPQGHWPCDATPQRAPARSHAGTRRVPTLSPRGRAAPGVPGGLQTNLGHGLASPPRPHPRFWDIPTPWGLQGRGAPAGSPFGFVRFCLIGRLFPRFFIAVNFPAAPLQAKNKRSTRAGRAVPVQRHLHNSLAR